MIVVRAGGGYITFDDEGTGKIHVKEDALILKRAGTVFTYYTSRWKKIVTFDESEVTSPAHTDADDLETILLSYTGVDVTATSVSVVNNSGVYTLSYTYSGGTEGSLPTQWEEIAIAGTEQEGQTLTATVTPTGTYTYQWYRSDDNQGTNESSISGATANTRVLDSNDTAKYLRIEATDGLGDTYSSYYTGAIASGSSNIHIGFGDYAGGSGDPTPLAPASTINNCNIQNGSNGSIADLLDIDGNATGYGLDITNHAAISGSAAGTAGDTSLFTAQTKLYLQRVTGSNQITITISSVDDADTFTIRCLHNINSGGSTNRGVTVSAGGSDPTTSPDGTYTVEAKNLETEQVLTGLTTDGSGNLLIVWEPELSGTDTAVLNAMEIEIE